MYLTGTKTMRTSAFRQDEDHAVAAAYFRGGLAEVWQAARHWQWRRRSRQAYAERLARWGIDVDDTAVACGLAKRVHGLSLAAGTPGVPASVTRRILVHHSASRLVFRAHPAHGAEAAALGFVPIAPP